ncbi:MAG: two-component system sensor histidine kinase CreC [Nitrospirota bacterium]
MSGVLSVGKPTRAARLFTEKSQRKIMMGGITVLVSMLLVVILLSGMITTPIRKLTEYARAVRDGKKVALPRLGKNEIAELGTAFEEMRDALEGKQYIERYVQTLAHEVKSPLSAIRGATDLLNENMAPEQQKHFIGNIRVESERIESIIEKLLLLSSLESKKTIRKNELINLYELIQNLRRNLTPLLEGKQLELDVSGTTSCNIEGDTFLISQAISNLLQNAIDFSPVGSKISAAVFRSNDNYIKIEIKDSGAGIPKYAIDKVYERFYSLKRPDTGKKSSGLGLSLVKEIVLLHNGTIELSNVPDGGTKATLSFPIRYS